MLQQVNCSPCLGVTLSDNIKWTIHINNLVKTTDATLCFLRRNLRCYPQGCRETACISSIRSSLEYSCIVWDPHQQGYIDKLECIQRRAARVITHSYRDHTPGVVTSMLHELKLQPLYQRRQQLRLLFFFKMVRGLVPAIPEDKYIHQQIGKRKIRPRTESDFKTTNSVRNHTRTNPSAT